MKKSITQTCVTTNSKKRIAPWKKIVAGMVIAAVSAVSAAHVNADSQTWTGNAVGNSNWSDVDNWDGINPVPGTGNTATFDLTGDNAVNLGTGVDVERTDFEGGGTWTFTGTSLDANYIYINGTTSVIMDGAELDLGSQLSLMNNSSVTLDQDIDGDFLSKVINGNNPDNATTSNFTAGDLTLLGGSAPAFVDNGINFNFTDVTLQGSTSITQRDTATNSLPGSFSASGKFLAEGNVQFITTDFTFNLNGEVETHAGSTVAGENINISGDNETHSIDGTLSASDTIEFSGDGSTATFGQFGEILAETLEISGKTTVNISNMPGANLDVDNITIDSGDTTGNGVLNATGHDIDLSGGGELTLGYGTLTADSITVDGDDYTDTKDSIVNVEDATFTEADQTATIKGTFNVANDLTFEGEGIISSTAKVDVKNTASFSGDNSHEINGNFTTVNMEIGGDGQVVVAPMNTTDPESPVFNITGNLTLEDGATETLLDATGRDLNDLQDVSLGENGTVIAADITVNGDYTDAEDGTSLIEADNLTFLKDTTVNGALEIAEDLTAIASDLTLGTTADVTVGGLTEVGGELTLKGAGNYDGASLETEDLLVWGNFTSEDGSEVVVNNLAELGADGLGTNSVVGGDFSAKNMISYGNLTVDGGWMDIDDINTPNENGIAEVVGNMSIVKGGDFYSKKLRVDGELAVSGANSDGDSSRLRVRDSVELTNATANNVLDREVLVGQLFSNGNLSVGANGTVIVGDASESPIGLGSTVVGGNMNVSGNFFGGDLIVGKGYDYDLEEWVVNNDSAFVSEAGSMVSLSDNAQFWGNSADNKIGGIFSAANGLSVANHLTIGNEGFLNSGNGATLVRGNLTLEGGAQAYGLDLVVNGNFADSADSTVAYGNSVILYGTSNEVKGSVSALQMFVENGLNVTGGTIDMTNSLSVGYDYFNDVATAGAFESTAASTIKVGGAVNFLGHDDTTAVENTIRGLFEAGQLNVTDNLTIRGGVFATDPDEVLGSAIVHGNAIIGGDLKLVDSGNNGSSVGADLTVGGNLGVGGVYSDTEKSIVDVDGIVLINESSTIKSKDFTAGALQAANDLTVEGVVDVAENVNVGGKLTNLGTLSGLDLVVFGDFADGADAETNFEDSIILLGDANSVDGEMNAKNLYTLNDLNVGSGYVTLTNSLVVGYDFENETATDGAYIGGADSNVLVEGLARFMGENAENRVDGWLTAGALHVANNLTIGEDGLIDVKTYAENPLGFAQVDGNLTLEENATLQGSTLVVYGDTISDDASNIDFQTGTVNLLGDINQIGGQFAAETLKVENGLTIIASTVPAQGADQFVVKGDARISGDLDIQDANGLGAQSEFGNLQVTGTFTDDTNSKTTVNDLAHLVGGGEVSGEFNAGSLLADGEFNVSLSGKAVVDTVSQFNEAASNDGLFDTDILIANDGYAVGGLGTTTVGIAGSEAQNSGNSWIKGGLLVADATDFQPEGGTFNGKNLVVDEMEVQEYGTVNLTGKTFAGIEGGTSASTIDGTYKGNGFEIVAGTDAANVNKVTIGDTADVTELNGLYTGNVNTEYDSTAQQSYFDGIVLKGENASFKGGDVKGSDGNGLGILSIADGATLDAGEVVVAGKYSDVAGSNLTAADGITFKDNTAIFSQNFYANGITAEKDLIIGSEAYVDAAVPEYGNGTTVNGNMLIANNATFLGNDLRVDGQYTDTASSVVDLYGKASFGGNSTIASTEFYSEGLETDADVSLTLAQGAQVNTNVGADLTDTLIGGDLNIGPDATLWAGNLNVAGNYNDHGSSYVNAAGEVVFNKHVTRVHSQDFNAGTFNNGMLDDGRPKVLILEEGANFTVHSESTNTGAIVLKNESTYGVNVDGDNGSLVNSGLLVASGNRAQTIAADYANNGTTVVGSGEAIGDPAVFGYATNPGKLKVDGTWTSGDESVAAFVVDKAGDIGKIEISGEASVGKFETGLVDFWGSDDNKKRLGLNANRAEGEDPLWIVKADSKSDVDAFTRDPMNIGKWNITLDSFIAGQDDEEARYWALNSTINTLVPGRSDLILMNLVAFDLPKHMTVSGPWFRMKGGKLTDDMSTFRNMTFQGLQIGWDKNITAALGNGCWFTGIFLEGDWNYGRGHYVEPGSDASVGSMKASYRGNGTGLYLNRTFTSGWYVDLTGRINLYDSKIETTMHDRDGRAGDDYKAKWTESVFSMAFEFGKQFNTRDCRFTFTPYNRLIYTSAPGRDYLVNYADQVTGATQVFNGAVDAWTNQVGARLYWNSRGANRSLGNIYVGADWYKGISGSYRANMRDVASNKLQTLETGRRFHSLSYGTATAGVTFIPRKNVTIGTEVEGIFGDVSGWSVNLSGRYRY